MKMLLPYSTVRLICALTLCLFSVVTHTPAQNPAPTPARPLIGSPTAAAGFQQLAKDRLASDFIQERFYKFKEAGDLWQPYSLFVPRNYDKAKKWPLIVNLHGLNITPVQQIRFEGLAELAEKYGYIVVCPMGYSVRSFWGIPNTGRGLIEGEPGFENQKNLTLSVPELAYADTMNVFKLVKQEFNIDENRIFLMGHSMGGAGAYFYAARHPEIWAGVAPIAGGGIDERYAPGEKVKDLTFLVLQGEKDLIINAAASRASVAKMKELGIKHTYIEVPGADHEVWIRHNPANMAKVFEFFNSLSKTTPKP
jgi:predicted peptidase